MITDGAHTIAETGAIVEYLIHTYGAGRLIPPADTEERLRYTYWLHFAEGSAMPPLVMTLVFGALPSRVPFFIRPVAKLISDNVTKSFLRPNIEAQLGLMETELGKSAWFAGNELTGADIMMSFPVEAAGSRGGLGENPRLQQWLSTVHGRPAYQAALKKGGSYAYA